MYYTKKKTDTQLEEGIDNAADICEELFNFINNLIAAMQKERASKNSLISLSRNKQNRKNRNVDRLIQDWEQK